MQNAIIPILAVSDVVILALISGFISLVVAVVAPAVLAYFTNRQTMANKKQDWQRQDEVAKQAREAARLLLVQNKKITNSAKQANVKLDVIHSFVNSDKTAAMQTTLDSKRMSLVLMKEVMSLKTAKGHKASSEALTALSELEVQIKSLQTALEDRIKQTIIADKEAEDAKKKRDELDQDDDEEVVDDPGGTEEPLDVLNSVKTAAIKVDKAADKVEKSADRIDNAVDKE